MLSSHLHRGALGALLISAVACSTDSSQASSRDIKVDGSSTVFVVSEAVAEQFKSFTGTFA